MESYIYERFFYDDTVLKESADEGATAHSGESTKGTNRDDSYDGANNQRGSNFIKPKLKETTWSLQRRDDEVRKNG